MTIWYLMPVWIHLQSQEHRYWMGVTKEFQMMKTKRCYRRGIYIKELEGILSEEEFGEFDKKIIQNPEEKLI